MPSKDEDERTAKAREITRAYNNLWSAQNAEARAAYMKEWEEKNREHRKQWRKEYYAKNREKIAAASAVQVKEWVKQNPERRREHQRRYREKNREKLQEANRIHVRESPTYAEVNGRKRLKRAVDLETMAGRPRPEVCDICAGPPDKGKSLHFDHCHQTGNFRGWLCRECNLMLGNSRDNPQRLRDGAAYLEGTFTPNSSN